MRILLTAFCFFTALQAYTQSIDTTLAKYSTGFQTEKVHLHYDKASYTTGDTVWYKIYLLEGLIPAAGSKTFYIDWTDESGKLLEHTTLPLQDGISFGQFKIPENYKGKYLHVKAFTKWMLNFDSSFIYEKDIRVLSALSNTTATTNRKIELNFFPEGGDEIAGLKNKIAFKANDQWGKPVAIKGVVVNSKGQIADSLRVLHDGMGVFAITPVVGETYTARWKDDKGKEYTNPLPVAKTSGMMLNVNSYINKKVFTVSADAGTIAQEKKARIIGTMNQSLVFNLEKEFVNGTIKATVPIESLPSGILTITVFNDKWIPQAERITYINNEDFGFKADMEVIHWGLNKRAKNEIEITLPDSLIASLSVSVTDAGIDRDSSNTIISQLMLTGDLKGQVYNPASYFQSNDDDGRNLIDLLMLTHGWRRFNWEQVVAGKLPAIKFEKDTSYLTLSGKIYGATATQLRDKPNIVLLLSQKEKGTANNFIQLPVSPDGNFNDPATIFFDTAFIYYQLSKSIKNASVKFMENKLSVSLARARAEGIFLSQSADTTGYARHFQLADEEEKLFESNKGKVLEGVTVKSQSKKPVEIMDEKYTSGLFSGGDSYQFDLVNDPFAASAIDIFSYLQGKVAGLQITAGSPPSLQWRGSAPSLFLDETPVEVDMLSGVSVQDIAYIKVLRPPFFGAAGGGAGGAIAVYTRRGDDANNKPGTGLANNKVAGYSSIRQFYSPNYSNYNPANEQKDLRTTLYWNPQVAMTPKNNKALLTFYNNDVSKAFRVVIEGMSEDGKLVHIEQIME